MAAQTLLDHRISRAWNELQHARRRGDCNKIVYWMQQVNSLLDRKKLEMTTHATQCKELP